jgi:undecaprenyl diphosphate synthase
MLEKITKVLSPKELAKFAKPKELKHVAVTLEATKQDMRYAAENKTTPEEVYDRRNKAVHWLLDAQIRLNIPVLSIYLIPAGPKDPEQFPAVVDSATSLFNELSINPQITKNQVKVSVLGKWYDLPGKLVESIKRLTDSTKDFDNFFLNLCVNYDGQEEIVDACRLIARKVAAEKLDPQTISKTDIKDNIYSSYFIPPQLIIKNDEKKQSDLLLWDSREAKIYFTGRPWQEFTQQDFLKAISSF